MMSNDVAPGAADRAQALFEGLTEGCWEEARQQFDEYMRGHIDAEGIAHGWKHAGRFRGQLRAGRRTIRSSDRRLYRGGGTAVLRGGGKGIGRVAYDRDGKVAGLSLQCRRRQRLDPRHTGSFALRNPDAPELITLGQRRRGGFRQGNAACRGDVQ